MKRIAWKATIVLVLAMLTMFYRRADEAYMPRCVWKTFTGLNCPGCGSQRFAHDLLNGNIGKAFSHNYILIIAIPLLLWLIYVERLRKKDIAKYMKYHTPKLPIIVMIIVVLWGVIRNIVGV